MTDIEQITENFNLILGDYEDKYKTSTMYVNKYMASRFPDDYYPVSNNNYISYMNRVTNGFFKMANSNIVIGMLARDIENIVRYSIDRIELLKSFFKNTYIIVYENDSIDNTKEILRSSSIIDTLITENDKFPIMEQDKSLQRREKMKHCRNILRDEMIKHEADYYLVYDADIYGGFSYEGIANSFSYEWDVCGSNSIIYDTSGDTIRRLYYDSWAWRDIGKYCEQNSEDINMRVYNRGDNPVECMSCFGGLALYNKIFKDKEYRYTSEDCDHTTIHIPMYENGAKIIMNPSQIVCYSKTRYVY